MLQMRIIITVLLFYTFSIDSLNGQSEKHSLHVYTGLSVGTPDKRFEFLQNQYVFDVVNAVISEIKNTTLDDEYFLGIKYHYKLFNRLNIGIGLGYAQLKQDFLLPANGKYFEQKIYPFFWRDYSRYHMVQLSPEIKLDLIKYKSLSIGINTKLISNISFRKEIDWQDLTINKTELFATELYPGIFSSFKRFGFDISYRVLYWKYRDDAIANNGLRVDTYNPSKWRFQVSYEFWRSKEK